MIRLEDLKVYQLAEKLSDKIWYSYDNWSYKAQKTIGLQVISSSDSISANISEGYGRYSFADRKRFYLYARGSYSETRTWIDKLYRRKIISDEEYNEYKELMDILGPGLNSFIRATKKASN